MNFLNIDDRLTYFNSKVQIWEHLKDRITSALNYRNDIRNSITTTQALHDYISEFRSFFKKQIGDIPDIGMPPKAKYLGEVKQDGILIQKLILETRPNVFATAALYIPDGISHKTPAVIFLCGHCVAGKSEYHILLRILASRGLIVLILDPTGQGERLNYYDNKIQKTRIREGTGDHEYSGFQCLIQGHNLSRYMLHDSIRAFDFLSTHPLVDTNRIGITGGSGGGAQTLLMMLVEPRLAAAAPCAFVTSRRSIFDSGIAQDAEQIWPGFSEAGYDHIDFLIAFAPKPLCVLSAEFDFFPIDGTHETLRDAKRFWEMFKSDDLLQFVKDRSVHGYTQALIHAAADFFVKAFQVGGKALMESQAFMAQCELSVTKSGQILGDYPTGKTIFHENNEAYKTTVKNKQKAFDFLKKAVFKARVPVDLNLRITQESVIGNIHTYSCFWWSQAGLLNSGILLRPADVESGKVPVTIALWEDGSRMIAQHDQWIREEITGGRAVLVLNVTGMGPLEPYPFNSEKILKAYYGTFFRICDDLITLGDSFAALRTYDVLRCIDALEMCDGLNLNCLRLYLHGPYGIYGALASFLDKRLSDVRWDKPMCSYLKILQSQYYNDLDIKSLIIPGLIRWADWTELKE